MDDPLNDIPMPYTISLRASTASWYYIQDHHRGSWASNYYKHQLPRGEYMIMASYAGPDDMQLVVQGAGAENRVIWMLDKGLKGVTRNGVTTITITQEIGYIFAQPITSISADSVEEKTPMVLTILPQQSFTP